MMKTKHQQFHVMKKAHHRSIAPSQSHHNMVNVDNYGAIANDGRVDNKAFEKAWDKACSNGAILVVPENSVYHLKPITFSGPCQPNTAFKIYGTIKAWPKRSAYGEDRRLWIMFDNITNFKVDGGGTINGNGKIWWKNSCKVNESLPCIGAPTAVTFNECNNLKVVNLRFKNAQQMHLRIQSCNNVLVSRLIVRAPGHSPNTDGIHVTQSQNVLISNSIIGTGDDCISIVSGSKNIQATDIICGPGHGISIGSLGKGNSEAEVTNVEVNRATLKGTTNGVRIKTWQGGSGFVRNIKFHNIAMRNVTNPIIIDQNYCDQKEECQQQDSAVQLSNILYQNIKGTSASEVAIKLECSQAVPCKGIHLQDVILTPEDNDYTIAKCDNVRYSKSGILNPKCHP
ncbi:Pectin lyase superfamily protein [Trifolium repens]|nr:Pectin lyase superfamily protein [Trifolium repens]